jgi:hypothetical protein
MIETTKAQLPKYVVGAIVDDNMNPMPVRVIEGKVCLRAKSPSKLSKDLRPKRCPNI